MTSLLIAGYLAVTNGRRISSENPNTKKSTNHVYYDTIIQTSGVDVGAEIRFWAPSTDPLYADGTVLDLLGKVYAPPNGTLHIDAIQVTPFPGDPHSDSYEDQIPDRPFPTLFVLGHSSGNPDTMDDGSIGYYVQTSEYVRDQSRTSRVYCRFDGSKPRWKKTPRPPSGSAVFIVGLAHGLHLAGGHLMVDVDQLQLNVGGAPASSSAARVEAGGSNKRRRFPTSTGAPEEASSSARRTNPFAGGTELSGSAPFENADDGEETLSSARSVPTSARGKKAGVTKRKAAARRVEPDENEE